MYIDIVDDTDLLLESRSLSGRQIFERNKKVCQIIKLTVDI